MPLAAGSRLGPYEIVAPLGAGGMGEVYRSHDTQLNRESEPGRARFVLITGLFDEVRRVAPVSGR